MSSTKSIYKLNSKYSNNHIILEWEGLTTKFEHWNATADLELMPLNLWCNIRESTTTQMCQYVWMYWLYEWGRLNAKGYMHEQCWLIWTWEYIHAYITVTELVEILTNESEYWQHECTDTEILNRWTTIFDNLNYKELVWLTVSDNPEAEYWYHEFW